MRCQCHLAQINIARAKAPINDPLMSGFVARLDDVNALADTSQGFVWRLKTEEGNATSLQPYDDPRVMVNLSVWETPEHLKQFVYKSAHTDVMRQRRQWFDRMGEVHMAMWWIERGHVPTVAEAKERLQYLRVHGESEFAFSFASLFPAPGTRMPDILESA
jgi:heme-degrading monooxygenase HmoA